MSAALGAWLIVHLTPVRSPVSPDGDQDQRNWVVRLAADLPDTWDADAASARLTERAAAQVRAAREASGLSLDAQRHAPVVRVVPIGGRHLVIAIVTVKVEDDDANAYLVAASAALVALDEMNGIDDIQGIPRHYWSALVGPS